jgi:hypothetical protein
LLIHGVFLQKRRGVSERDINFIDQRDEQRISEQRRVEIQSGLFQNEVLIRCQTTGNNDDVDDDIDILD